MKIRVEVEVEPTELREFLGLPDVSSLQQDALDTLSRKLRTGAEGVDPVAILRGLVPTGLLSLEEWQRLLRRALDTGHAEAEKKVSKAPRRKKKPRS
jgi:hypothetical protein